MNKKVILLPLIGLFLSSCGRNPTTTSDISGNKTSDIDEQEQLQDEPSEEEIAERIASGKTDAKTWLDQLAEPLINKINYEDLKQLVQTFYDSEKSYIESITTLQDATAAYNKVGTDFITFLVGTLRPSVVTKLNSLVNPIISQITVIELKEAVQAFYDDEISELNVAVSSTDIINYLLYLKDDVLTFISGETGRLLLEFKNQAIGKVDELLTPLITKISNQDLKTSVQNFVTSEKQRLQAITDLEEAKAAISFVTSDVLAFAVDTFKPLLIATLNGIINPFISAIEYAPLKESVQNFYEEEIDNLDSVTKLSDLIDAFSEIKAGFEEFVVSETEKVLTALKNKAIEELDPYVEALIDKIPYEELEDDVEAFYLEEKAILLAVSSIDDFDTAVNELKEDVFNFALSETKKIAIGKLKEVVDTGINKMPNVSFRNDLSTFANTEYAKLEAVTKIEDVPSVLVTVTGETVAYIKALVVSTVKDYVDDLIEIKMLTPYGFVSSPMDPSFKPNLVGENDINYNFENFTNVLTIKKSGFGEQWQMVVENVNQCIKLSKGLNVAQTVLNAVTQVIKDYIEISYAEEINYTFDKSDDGFKGSFSYKDLVLSADIEMTNEFNIPLAGNVKPVLSMKYNLLNNEKELFISLGDAYRLRYIFSSTKYVMAATYGVTIGGKTGSRSCYLSVNQNDNGTSVGHVYEYTSFEGQDLIKACADFYATTDYVSVVGNKASGMALFDGYVNELYSKTEGRLIGYEVREEKSISILPKMQYNTLWFNLWDISGINDVKVTEKTDANKSTRSTVDVYLNRSDNLFVPAYNTKGVKTSRKYDIELRSRFYYTYDEINNEYVAHEVMVPMMFIQEGANFNSFETDVTEHNDGLTLSVSLKQTHLNKILDDYDNLIDVFIENKESISSDAIKEYLGIEEE